MQVHDRSLAEVLFPAFAPRMDPGQLPGSLGAAFAAALLCCAADASDGDAPASEVQLANQVHHLILFHQRCNDCHATLPFNVVTVARCMESLAWI